ncbi:MAG: ABC transporter permease [Saprospiraceae bacterium]
MLRNYLTVALRNLWKHKFYSIINILGLAIGLACFLFIFLFIRDELSYDRYHQKADRTYRVNFDGFAFEQELHFAVVGASLGPTILEEYPEVEQQCRFRQRGSFAVRYEDQSYTEDKWIYADSTLFDVFSFELVKGNPRSALKEPFTIVISEEIAKKYFGEADPIGKSLTANNDRLYRVTGVMKEMPKNTHFNFNMLASMASLEESRNNMWLSNNFQTYIVLKEGVDPAIVDAKFDKLVRDHVGPEIEQFMGKTYDDLLAAGSFITFSLFPMPKIHLYSDKQAELGATSDIKYIYIFSFVGLFILLLACINFMNLSTARSASRAKEVGMRKVVGAGRSQLIFQFLSESVIITFLGFLLAIVLLVSLLSKFNTLSGKELTFSQINHPGLWAMMLGMVLFVGVVAGSYPAFYLSAFKPIAVLKGRLIKKIGQQVSLRSVLVIFQFAITVALIVGTMIISSQLNYIQNKKLGFNKEQVLILNNFYTLGNNCQAFKDEILKNPQVINASMSSSLPTPSSRNTSATFLGRTPDPTKTHVVQLFTVDQEYIPTLGMEIVQGRAFSREFPSDSSAVILNESAVAMYGLEEPLGQEISVFSGGTPENPEINTTKVIGVVKNFHFESLRSEIGPLALFLGTSRGNLSIKLKAGDIPSFISAVQQKWNEMGPGQPFDYNFMDEEFATVYESETRIGQIFSVFTFLAIFIACLGLFGLATFTAEQRTKEVGIRKVIGASISRIFVLLTVEIMKWVLIANLIALPVAYYFMGKWLEGFAYPVDLHWLTFIMALVLSLFIALLTVSYQALRTAWMKPVRSLRYE